MDNMASQKRVDQSLGDVVDGDSGLLRDAAQVDDALVGHEAAVADVEDGKVITDALCDVVGRRDGH